MSENFEPCAPPRAILESLFTSIDDSLLVLDRELTVVAANDPLLARLGRAPQEVIGQRWEDLFPHLAATGRLYDLRQVLAEGIPHRGRVPLRDSREGVGHLFDVATYPVRDPATGRVTHAVEYAREITDEVRLQLEVMDANENLMRITEELEEKTLALDRANQEMEGKCRSLEAANRRLERLAVIDVMTDLPNHRAFQEHLSYQSRVALRHARPFSLLLFDVDNFKQYNDRYGHPKGDLLLATLAKIILKSIRAVDLPARYGGEEFAIILPETDKFGAAVVAERLRASVAAHEFEYAPVTVSVGVAEFPSDTRDGADLIACADKAMYHAKSSGKNAVSLWRGALGGPALQGRGDMRSAISHCHPLPNGGAAFPSGSASRRSLLLVDEDELSLGTLREALIARGYAVTTAESGQEALRHLSTGLSVVDLILTDLALPDKTGFELRAESRVLHPGVPIIFLTAYGNLDLIHQALDDGASAFVAKPFQIDDLISLIEQTLARTADIALAG